jgi:hypothetical protein
MKRKNEEDLAIVALETHKFQLTKDLGKWERLTARRIELESKRDKKLKPHRDTFDLAAEPIVAAADKELAPVLQEIATLEQLITVALLGAVKPDGTIPIPQLEKGRAIAEVTLDEKRESRRRNYSPTSRPPIAILNFGIVSES